MPKSQTSSQELLAAIDRTASTPFYEQLTHALRDAVRAGRLRGGTALPSSRRLAAELGVSRAVVVEAYAQLVAEGYLVSRQGAATRIASLDRRTASPPPRPTGSSRPTYDLRPGRPDPALFPRRAWLKALRHTTANATDEQLGAYPDPGGPQALRAELSGYLGRVRGTVVAEDQVVVCAGVAQGLGLVAATLAVGGIDRIAVEDPSSPGTRQVLAAAGLQPLAVPVDDRGLDVQALRRSSARVVLVTPAHQFPTGVILDPDRRSALLDWAREGGWIVEDDYDAEFRYDRAPVGALQGLAPDRVIYVGSVSKTLSPALRLGWTVAPHPIAETIREFKRLADLGCPTLEGLALARLIATGGYDRHLRSVRRTYLRRRDALIAALKPQPDGLEVLGAAAGLHLTLTLPIGVDEVAVLARCADHGVTVGALSDCQSRPSRHGGILLGYAALPEPALTAAATHLTQALQLIAAPPGSTDQPLPASARVP